MGLVPVSLLGLLIFFVPILFQSTAQAQGTAEDFARMDRQGRLGNTLVDRRSIRPRWLLEQEAMWYQVEVAGGHAEYYLVRLDDGQKKLLFETRQLNRQLSQLTADPAPAAEAEGSQAGQETETGPRQSDRREAGGTQETEAADEAERGQAQDARAQDAQDRGRGRADTGRARQAAGRGGRGRGQSDQAGLLNLDLHFSESLDQVSFRYQGQAYRLEIPSGQWSLIDTAELPTEVQSLSELQVSGGSDQRIEVEFQNALDKVIELIWIDTQGRPQSYGTIEAGQSKRQGTFAGHFWLVRDDQGKNLAMVESRYADQVIAIDSDQVIQIRVPRALRRVGGFYLQGNPANESGQAARESSTDTPAVRPARSNRRSPDRRWSASVENHCLVVEDSQTGEKKMLGADGHEQHFYTGQFFWSPDSQFLVALQEQPPQRREVHLIESSPRDQLQPKLHSFNYLKPGDQIRLVQPRLFDLARGQQVEVSDELFPTPWGIHDFRWDAESTEFSFRYNQRGHQVMRVVGIRTDGSTRAIIDEVSDTFIDYTGKFFVDYIDSTGEIIWASQRDGWNHLYLYDRQTGQVNNQITSGPWVVRDVQRVDAQARRIWFTAGGIHPDQDPYHVHYCHVDFEGQDLVVMTAGDGNHRVDYSPDERYLLATYSRVDLPPITELREVETGRLVCVLEEASWSRLLAAGWRPPQRFQAKGRDGQTDIYGVIYRPSNYDPDQRYPVIEYIYAGPQGAFVPKSFTPTRWEKSLAELGFIVVQIDGMGTNHRSKAFHDVCWQNLGDAGFPDRMLWMQAAAAEDPAMDLSRVGIFGGSAGGQNAARAVLAFGDFYHVAVADCGCHDNRMDKIWWNEQWMGWPIGDHYAEQSNVTQAGNLEGKLFLIVGELDRNVDPASTMQLADALVRANKDFDLLVVPGGGHGVGSSPYGRRRTADFFVRHLLNVEPRRQ